MLFQRAHFAIGAANMKTVVPSSIIGSISLLNSSMSKGFGARTLSGKNQLKFPAGFLNRPAKSRFEAATGTRGLSALMCECAVILIYL
jgi:hypothetical protein